MPVLRGHHLICLHFFDGEGYDDAFIANLREVIRRAPEEGVTVGEGADDVCAPCRHRHGESCTFSRSADREIRQMDSRALKLLGLADGRRVSWDSLREKTVDVFPAWYLAYCFACSWRPVCEKHDLFRLLKDGVRS